MATKTVEVSLTAEAVDNDPASHADFVIPLAAPLELREGDTVTSQAYVANGLSPGNQFIVVTSANGTGYINATFGSFVRQISLVGGGPTPLNFDMNQADAWKYLFYAAALGTPAPPLCTVNVTVTIPPGVYTPDAITDIINDRLNDTQARTLVSQSAYALGGFVTTAPLGPFQALVYSTDPGILTRSMITADGTTYPTVAYEYASDGNRTDCQSFTPGTFVNTPYIVGANSPTLEYDSARNLFAFTGFSNPCHNTDGTRSIVVSLGSATSFWPQSSFNALRFHEPANGGLWSLLGFEAQLNTPAQMAVSTADSNLVAAVNFSTTTSEFYPSTADSITQLMPAPNWYLAAPFFAATIPGTSEYFFEWNSTKISGGLPAFGGGPYYVILTDLLAPDEVSFTSSATRNRLPVACLCPGGYQTPGGFQNGLIAGNVAQLVTHSRTVRSIRVRIENPDRTLPQLKLGSSVVFTIYPGQRSG